jgi:hypothetical protein
MNSELAIYRLNVDMHSIDRSSLRLLSDDVSTKEVICYLTTPGDEAELLNNL